jgi:CheY-like chemotaxis protein
MIEKVVDNLISNAIKYSHEGGTVIINFSCNKKTWIMTVKDQGIGISQKGQKQLFKEFYRSENAVNSEVIGSGIGLLMVKNYVEKHGGSITCLSRENEGSTFKIEIPLRRKLSGYPVSEKGFVESESHIAADNASDTIVVKENTGKQKSLSILIVEDNEKLKNFLEVSLSDEFNVTSASNGREAWELITKKFPDIVVSDIMMPEMDGFELCRKIKSTYDTSHIPLILLTALTEKAEQLHGLGLGADAYLTKPFDISLLIGRIKSIVLNRKTIREKALKLIDRESNGPIIENELNDKFVKKALEVVKSNISNPQFGKDEFAFEMNVSSSLLYKKVKSLTDQSPSDFIKSVRLNYALELLQSGEHTVTEISEKAGFSSLGYFSTVFKKFYGKLPTDILNAK